MLNSQAQRLLTFSLLAVSCLMTTLVTGCAYRAGFGERHIPGGYKTMAVPIFKNATHEAGIEVYFTNAFIREVERAQIGSVTEKSSAQVTLEGAIDDVKYVIVEQKTGDELNLPRNTVLNSQYRVVVTSTLRLRRNSDQRVLWEGQFQKEQNYRTPRLAGAINTPDTPDARTGEALTGANALYNHSARYQVIQNLATDMMTEAHDRLTENF